MLLPTTLLLLTPLTLTLASQQPQPQPRALQTLPNPQLNPRGIPLPKDIAPAPEGATGGAAGGTNAIEYGNLGSAGSGKSWAEAGQHGNDIGQNVANAAGGASSTETGAGGSTTVVMASPHSTGLYELAAMTLNTTTSGVPGPTGTGAASAVTGQPTAVSSGAGKLGGGLLSAGVLGLAAWVVLGR